MAGITLEIATAERDKCIEALSKAATLQSAGRAGKNMARGEHASLLKALQYWDRMCLRLGISSGISVVEVIPR